MPAIRRTEELLRRIDALCTFELKSAFAQQQVDMFEAFIRRLTEYAESTQHSVTFYECIGAGASTATCALAGLRVVGFKAPRLRPADRKSVRTSGPGSRR